MICPSCKAYAEVLETRANADGMRRRYECANLHRFTTQERPVVRDVANTCFFSMAGDRDRKAINGAN